MKDMISKSVHHNRNVIVHILIDIPYKARRHDTEDPECNANIIHPLVALCKADTTRSEDDFICCVIASDSRDMLQFFDQGDASQFNGVFDKSLIGDAELEFHGTADVVGSIGLEFVGEDIVVDSVADRATDDADGEGEGGNSRDEVVRTDYCRDDRGRNNDSPNAKAGDCE